MSKLDKTKETLNTLRASFGILVAIVLTLTAGLLDLYYKENIDILFYIGALFDTIMVIILIFIARMVIKNIEIIEEL